MPFFDAKAVLLAALCCLPAGQASAQRAPERAERVFAEAHGLYADAFYEQAIDRFETFLGRWPNHDNAAEALYYQAEASLITGHGEQAVMLFTRFRRRHRSHPFAPTASFTLGQHFYATGRYQRAIDELALALVPSFPAESGSKALYWMGESARNLGRLEEALTYFHRTSDEYSETDAAPRALYAAGLLHVDLEAYDDAAAAFRLLGERHPDSPLARTVGLALAEIFYTLERYDAVVTEALDHLQLLPREATGRALFIVANSYARLGDSANAATYYRRVIEEHPGGEYHREAVFGLAWALHRESAWASAAERFAELAWSGDDDLALSAAYHAGANNLLADRRDAALQMFRRVADEWPESEFARRALFEIGASAYDRQDWPEVRDAFGRLLRTHPEAPKRREALLMRSYASVALDDPETAWDDFERAAELGVADPGLREEITYHRTWARYREGHYREAGPSFFEIYERDPAGAKAGDALFWAAESAYQIGEYELASSLFRRYGREYAGAERAAEARYALGWIAFRGADYDRAVEEFEAFLRLSSDGASFATDARLRLGDANYGLKRFSEAIRHYELAGAPVRDYALFQIGQSHANDGSPAEAERAFRALLGGHPDSEFREEAHYALGYLHFQGGSYNRAIEEYRTLIGWYPRDPLAAKAQYGIGDALFNAGRFSDAVEEYARVLTAHSGSPYAPEAASSLQYAAIASGDETEGLRIIDEFIEANPNLAVASELRFRQAEVKFQGGRLSEAAEEFRRFAERYPQAPQVADAWFFVASIREETGLEREAEAAFRHVMTSHPDSPRSGEAAGRLGGLLLRSERPADALEAFRRQESRADEYDRPAALYGQARALIALGRAAEAEALLRPTVEAQPDAAPAVLGMARATEAQGRLAEAIPLYERVVRLSAEETGAEALLALGRALLESGDARRAVEELTRMTALYSFAPDFVARGYLLQAEAFRVLGQPGEATLLYDRVTADYDGSAWADSARAGKAKL